jgi:hypothetical protein
MNAANQTIAFVKQSLNNLPYDNYTLIGVEEFIQHVPDWEHLSTPTQMLCDMPLDVGHEISYRVLGSYQPMNSPGVITLYQDNLKRFYWSVVREITRSLPSMPFSRQDLEFLVDFIVNKTWHHELFHHSMEVTRHLVNGQPYTPEEEPLAVAYSRQCLRDNAWNSKVGRLGKVVYNLAMEIAFDCYPAPYRDWPRYDSPERLKNGIVDLLQPMRSAFLENSGVPVSDVLIRLIPMEYGFHERVI